MPSCFFFEINTWDDRFTFRVDIAIQRLNFRDSADDLTVSVDEIECIVVNRFHHHNASFIYIAIDRFPFFVMLCKNSHPIVKSTRIQIGSAYGTFPFYIQKSPWSSFFLLNTEIAFAVSTDFIVFGFQHQFSLTVNVAIAVPFTYYGVIALKTHGIVELRCDYETVFRIHITKKTRFFILTGQQLLTKCQRTNQKHDGDGHDYSEETSCVKK